MAAGTDVAALAADLARAVELTMSASAAQADRLKAYTACETFKETSPLCAEAGLFLAAGAQHSPIARHFGLQLMEHTVKYRWTQIGQPEKLFIKENAMKLLAAGGIGDEPHVKDALSRVVVEMVKREWPQQWPSLLAELSEACSFGEVQTELVLMVFLRLVEDVALLQTLESNQRRKDIYQALTTNMAHIFEFFLRLIELHVGQFRACTAEGSLKAAGHSRVVQVVLLTLTGFVEWVSMTHIMAQNGRLLHILCLLLNDRAFQYSAAECLSQIVNRKGKTEERKQLLILFNGEAIQYLYSSTKIAQPNIFDDQIYLFQKKLTQVLSGLCAQLCLLWGKDSIGRPPNFNMFLDAALEFSAHPSLALAHLVNPLWNTMLKHDHVSRDSIFVSYLPRWLEFTAPRIVRQSYSDGQHSTALYCRADFDCEEEYFIYFHRARADFLDSIRQATCVSPIVMFSYVEQWVLRCLQLPVTPSATGNKNGPTATAVAPSIIPQMTESDPIFLEWEAAGTCLESVLSRVLQASTERPSIAAGLRLLQLCLNHQPGDPLLLSTLLTCISALFVFLSMSSGQMATTAAGNSIALSGAALLPLVLDKIFNALVFVPAGENNKDTRSRAVKNVRRHAASLMVKIGNKYPLLLLPVFEQIRATVVTLCNHQQGGPCQLNMLERVTLQEALLLISNHFGDYERQTQFIGDVMRESQAAWVQMADLGVFKGAAEFMAFIGLDKPPENDGPKSQYAVNRCKLMTAICMLLGAVKRCNWPDDPERATRGGFVVAMTESGNPICRNPAARHIVPLLPHVLSVFRIYNELYSPGASLIHSRHYKGCLQMLDSDRTMLLGNVGHASVCNTGNAVALGSPTLPGGSDRHDPSSHSMLDPVERMQRHLASLHESCYHLLGSMGTSLGRDLYSLSDLGPAIVSSVLQYLEYIPDFRLRPIVRVFLKPFIYSCPQPFYETVLLPIMAYIAPYMSDRLQARWQHVNQLVAQAQQLQQPDDDSAPSDAQEVLDDILTRALTREYLELLKVALVGGSLTPDSSQDTMDTEDTNDRATPTMTNAGGAPARNNLTSEVISDLGALLLRSEQTCQSLVITVLGALSWIDSISSLRATQLTSSMIRFLVSAGTMTTPLANHVVMTVLKALNEHGQHEANQGSLLTLGAQMYELLRPSFPSVLEVMQQIPGINPADLQKFDERISFTSANGAGMMAQSNMGVPTVASSRGGSNKVEKVKKDLFKKLTSHLIGKSVGQLFKKDVKINDLPKVVFPTKSDKKTDTVPVPDLRGMFNA